MIWTPDPPADNGQPPLPVFRVKPGRPLTCVIMCARWCGVMTHYFNNQTIVHRETDCPACDRNWAPIWQGFLVVGSRDQKTMMLLQITHNGAKSLAAFEHPNRRFMGCIVVWSRLGRRTNSPLHAQCIGWETVKHEWSEDRLGACVARLLRVNVINPT